MPKKPSGTRPRVQRGVTAFIAGVTAAICGFYFLPSPGLPTLVEVALTGGSVALIVFGLARMRQAAVEPHTTASVRGSTRARARARCSAVFDFPNALLGTLCQVAVCLQRERTGSWPRCVGMVILPAVMILMLYVVLAPPGKSESSGPSELLAEDPPESVYCGLALGQLYSLYMHEGDMGPQDLFVGEADIESRFRKSCQTRPGKRIRCLAQAESFEEARDCRLVPK